MPRWSSTSMVRACRPPAREPSSSWSARRSTMTTSIPASASSAASISPVGPPPAITTACSVMRLLRRAVLAVAAQPKRSWSARFDRLRQAPSPRVTLGTAGRVDALPGFESLSLLPPSSNRATIHPMNGLPPLTGPHPVGRTAIRCTDRHRRERYSDDPDARRSLVLWIWYPAAADDRDDTGRLPPGAVGSDRHVPRPRHLGHAEPRDRRRAHPRRRRAVPRAPALTHGVPAPVPRGARRGARKLRQRGGRRQPHVRNRGHRVPRR